MRPVLAAAVCLMLGSSSFSYRSLIDAAQPTPIRSVHRAALAGDTIPMLTGWGAALALVIEK